MILSADACRVPYVVFWYFIAPLPLLLSLKNKVRVNGKLRDNRAMSECGVPHMLAPLPSASVLNLERFTCFIIDN